MQIWNEALDILDAASKRQDPTGGLYSQLTAAELWAMGIDPNSLHDSFTGFDACVYRGPSGQLIVAFPGTDSIADWGRNFAGVRSSTDQDRQALSLALAVQKANPSGELMFVGHSHGGRLATLASVATGREAVTLNAEGVNQLELRFAARVGGQSLDEASSRVTALVVQGELLNKLQSPPGVHDAFGQRVDLPYEKVIPNDPGSILGTTQHGIRAAKTGMGQLLSGAF
jgi:hypothetical protein